MAILQIIWNVDPEVLRIGGFSLRYYSLLFAVAFLLGYWLMKKMYRKEGLPEERVGSLLIYIIAGTIIGARLGQVFFYEFGYYKDHLLEILLPFKIRPNGLEWTGFQGLASHGGAIGILIALAFYCKKYQQNFLQTVDKLVIVVALAGFFIRLGNLFNSEIIGEPTSVAWAFVFQKIDAIPRHPSQLYEAVAYLAIFFLLWNLYKRKWAMLQKGVLFGLFLVLVFAARFVIEFTKEPQETFEKSLPINMGQILSLPFILLGAYFIFRRRPKASILQQSNE
jgi:phosphatidylglycerol---prolipoprotein diacylglyceryl transferase